MLTFFKKINHTYIKVMAFITCYLMSNMAFADIVADAQSQSGDESMKQLAKAIGGVGSYLQGESIYNFSGMLEKYNSIIFGAGVVWLTYIMVKGLVDSSHDGEFLGKNTHSAWVPIRIAVATSMMAPVIGGFALAQIVMVGAAGTGVMAANAVWSAAKGNMGSATVSGLAPIVGVVPPAGLLEGIKMGVCKETFNNHIKQISTSELSPPTYFSTVQTGLNFSTERGNSYLPDFSCGTIEYEIKPSSSYENLDFTGATAGKFAALNTKLMNIGSGLVTSNFKLDQGTTNANAATATLDWNSIYSQVGGEVQAITNTIKTTAATNPNTDLQLKLAKFNTYIGDSWWFAGGYWVAKSLDFSTSGHVSIEINNLQDPLGGVSGNTFSVSSISHGMASMIDKMKSLVTSEANESQAADEAAALITKINNKFKVDDKGIPTLGPNVNTTGGTTTNASGTTTGTVDANTGLFSGPFQILSDMADPAKVLKDDFDVMSQLVVLGQGLLGYAMLAFTTSFTVGMGSSIPWIGGALSSLSGVAATIASFLILPGIMLAFYLPMLPLINWITGLLSWLITVIEAILAAPLWALVHLDTHGEGTVSQKSAHGYIFLFGTVLKPPLMVFGLVLGYALIKIIVPVALLLISYIAITYASSQGLSSFDWTMVFHSPFITIVVFGIFPAFIYFSVTTLVNRCFSLIHILPDQIISWVGGHFRGTGETDAGQVGNATMGGLAAGKMAGNAISKGGSAAGKMAGKGVAKTWNRFKNRGQD